MFLAISKNRLTKEGETMKRILRISVILALFSPAIALCAQPMDTLKVPVDKVIEILSQSRPDNPEQKKIQQQKMWDVVSPFFDYSFIAKSVLGRFHWEKTFTPSQREDFTDVFSRFLGNNYIKKIQEGYENQKVVFLNEEILNPTKAVVKTAIPRKNDQIPVDYQMRLNNGQWKIYDVQVEGVSLLENYRSQIRSTLLNQTAAQLIEQLKSKI
jgi:phospholipid transport system substrate-binding protein